MVVVVVVGSGTVVVVVVGSGAVVVVVGGGLVVVVVGVVGWVVGGLAVVGGSVGRVVVGVEGVVTVGVVGVGVVGGVGDVVVAPPPRRSRGAVVVVAGAVVVVDCATTAGWFSGTGLVEEVGVNWPENEGSGSSTPGDDPSPLMSSPTQGNAARAPKPIPRAMAAIPVPRSTPAVGNGRRRFRLGADERNCSASFLASDSGSSLSPSKGSGIPRVPPTSATLREGTQSDSVATHCQ